MKIFHVDSSAKRERANSRALSRQFIENLRAAGVDVEIDYLDVTVDTPPHVTEAFAIATYKEEHERTAEMRALRRASDSWLHRHPAPARTSCVPKLQGRIQRTAALRGLLFAPLRVTRAPGVAVLYARGA